jgi:NAD(P)H-flavin reductase
MIALQPAPLHPLVPAITRIARVRRDLADVFTIHLDVSARPGGFAFAPGQFNMLYAFGAGEVAISISGDPARPGELVHTIRAVGTVTRVLEGLRRGDTIGVRGPYGSAWPMDAARGKDLVIIAGGVGLAPLRPAILHALAHRADYGRVVVLYGARTPGDILFRKDIERWRGRLDTSVEVTVDRAPAEWPGNVGVVTSLLGAARFDAANAVALVCGPEVMMRFCVRELEKRGMPHEAMYVSMERSMKCGAGLCGHCQYGPTFVCKDGPVFRFDRIERLFYTREI